MIEKFNEIINSDAESEWNSTAVNKAFKKIDKLVSTDLENSVLSVDGTQSVQGQKTFLNAYLTGTSIPSYDSVMSYLQNDISPVFNSGAKGVSTNVAKELSFSKANVSGNVIDLAQRNPVYRKGNINIKWGLSDDDYLIQYECNNVVIPKTNNPQPASTEAKLDVTERVINTSEYLTSASFSGTISATDVYPIRTAVRGYSLIGYITDRQETGVLLYATAESPSITINYNVRAITNTNGTIVGYKRLGFIYTPDAGVFSAAKQETVNNSIYFYTKINPLTIFNFREVGMGWIINSDCVLDISYLGNLFPIQNPRLFPSISGGTQSNLYTFDEITNDKGYNLTSLRYKAPLFIDKNTKRYKLPNALTWYSDGSLVTDTARIVSLTYFP